MLQRCAHCVQHKNAGDRQCIISDTALVVPSVPDRRSGAGAGMMSEVVLGLSRTARHTRMFEGAPAELGAEENNASAMTMRERNLLGQHQQTTILLAELGVKRKMQGNKDARRPAGAWSTAGVRPGAAKLHPTVEMRGHPGAHVPGASPRSFVHTLTLFA